MRPEESRSKLNLSSVKVSLPLRETMRVVLLICMPVLLLAQPPHEEERFHLVGDYDSDYFPEAPDVLKNHDSFPDTYQRLTRLDQLIRPEKSESDLETEPTEPGPLDCREEQYPCTRLYSVHKPCKQCLNNICFYSLRRVYVINKEICVRTVCAHEELLRADLCRDQFSRCGVAALSGQCASLGGSCGKSCGGC
ncbi:microfibrillar-associated protein 2 [Thalassophryne amazonica]|uniref:microfibrillar-associated protein 2 n=1 Tax=Thalassophryne amazonica TaxID=390379 RepID=UPI001470AED9|nr:microfibrillar-associated protein 2 [Thalassophryne amazonica]